MSDSSISRRSFCAATSAALVSGLVRQPSVAVEPSAFQLKYLLGSCLYGYQYVGEIFPEVREAGASAIDIWPKVHGNQREQLADLGQEKFATMLQQHDITLGCITQYKLGPFGLQDEMRLAERFGWIDEGGKVSRTSKHLAKFGGIAVDIIAVDPRTREPIRQRQLGEVCRLYFDWVKEETKQP